MKTTHSELNKSVESLLRVVLVTVAILLVPLVAMQFSDEVDWNVFDFIIMGGLLLSIGMAYELITQRVHTTRQKLLVAAVLGAGLLLIWAELAVGIVGSPFAGS